FLEDFHTDAYVVSPSGSCTGFVRGEMEALFSNSAQHRDLGRLLPKVYEFTEFLIKVLKVDSFDASFAARATYHDACGALRECGIKEGPRALLSQVKGLELVENSQSE